MTRAARVPHSEKLSIFVDDEINETLDEFLSKNEPDVTLPFEWSPWDTDGFGGPPVSDPLTIHFSIDDNALWSTTLEDILIEVVDGHVNPQKLLVEADEGKTVLRSMSARLRELADFLDGKIG